METGLGIPPYDPPISVLQDWKIRALPVALARRIAATEPSDPYMRTLNRLFRALPRNQQALCLVEISKSWME